MHGSAASLIQDDNDVAAEAEVEDRKDLFTADGKISDVEKYVLSVIKAVDQE